MAKQILQIENIEAKELLDRLDKLDGAILALNLQQNESDFITRRDVALFYKISVSKIHDMTKKGVLPHYRIGNKLFYKRLEVQQALMHQNQTI